MLLRALALAGAALAGCAAASNVTVFAAASLTDAFADVARAFEAARPGEHVILNFAGSSTLATQILQGAPADVFASANEQQMARVSDADLTASTPRPFVTNRLVVLVPEDSDLSSLADLARPGILLVLAAPEVPAGHYADAMFLAADAVYGAGFRDAVERNVVSREPNVRQAAAKVALGAADAAVVYATDATGLDGVRALPVEDDLQPVVVYPIAPLVDGSAPETGAAFVDFVLSATGRAILQGYGFASPP